MIKTHILQIDNADIIKDIESRTFKFGKAHDGMATGIGRAKVSYTEKLVNNVKLTDLGYDRALVIGWIDEAIGNIRSAFMKYNGTIETAGSGELKQTRVTFSLSSKWPTANGDGFNKDCREYVVNYVISDFLSLSLPGESELYAQKAMQALKDAERKLYYKTA